jgi:superfamily II DNA or RNA helicase
MKTIPAIINSHLVVQEKHMPDRVLDELRSALTWDNPDYKDAMFRRGNTSRIPPTISGIKRDRGKFIISREFWQEFLTFAEMYGYDVDFDDQTVFNKPKPLDIKFTPWKSQRKAIRRLLDPKVGHQGVLKAPCGSGKTNILLYVAATLGQNTIVLAHTNDLLEQWRQRCRNLVGIDPGIIQGDKFELKQITLASVMTLARRELDNDFLRHWGCVILDEAHHCPANSFKEVLDQFPAYFRFGATATPTRADNLEGLLFAICGDVVAEITYEELEEEGVIVRPIVRIEETGLSIKYTGSVRDNPRVWHTITESVVKSKKRNKQIADTIVAEASRGANLQLVLSKQIDHLRYIERCVRELSPRLSTALLVASSGKSGGAVALSKDERKVVLDEARKGTIRVLFGTSLADEGLDIPRLDRLHLTFPTRAEGKIEQQIGRIQRAFPGKRTAIVHDYVDNISLLRNQALNRRKVYKQIGLEVTR